MISKRIKVKLRRKLCADNMESLYLDYYPPILNPDTQKPQRWEYLGIKIYAIEKTETIAFMDNKGRRQIKIVPIFHKTKVDKNGKPLRQKNVLSQMQKNHNNEQLSYAEEIRMIRQISVNKQDFEFASSRMHTTNFIEFFKEIAQTKRKSNSCVWMSACKILEKHLTEVGNTLMCDSVDRAFSEEYYKYLGGNVKLKQNTKVSYFSKFKLAIKEAEKRKVIREGTFESIHDLAIKEEDVNIEFLTLEELSVVKEVPCSNELYKKAALFSACTGLRRGDIINFSWEQIKNSNDGLYIDMRQQKTAGVESIGLNEMALSLLGDRQEDGVRPFGVLENVAWVTQDKTLKQWLTDAGIKKKITFHCFRHTFACALLHNKVDIFRVSKLLGHKSVLTTQRTYAKLLTSDKKKAIDTINF